MRQVKRFTIIVLFVAIESVSSFTTSFAEPKARVVAGFASGGTKLWAFSHDCNLIRSSITRAFTTITPVFIGAHSFRVLDSVDCADGRTFLHIAWFNHDGKLQQAGVEQSDVLATLNTDPANGLLTAGTPIWTLEKQCSDLKKIGTFNQLINFRVVGVLSCADNRKFLTIQYLDANDNGHFDVIEYSDKIVTRSGVDPEVVEVPSWTKTWTGVCEDLKSTRYIFVQSTRADVLAIIPCTNGKKFMIVGFYDKKGAYFKATIDASDLR